MRHIAAGLLHNNSFSGPEFPGRCSNFVLLHIFFAGIYYTMTIIGPAVGYVAGGQLLLLYTDFLTVDPLT